MSEKYWRSNGKLLLTGEYLAMEGAWALGIPLKKGQTLSVSEKRSTKPILHWTAFKPSGLWFEAVFRLSDLKILSTNNTIMANDLLKLLNYCKSHSKRFPVGEKEVSVKTKLEFNSQFGWGSSSTLVANIGEWLKINPFKIQETVFGGSGYDIACAQNNTAILYKKTKPSPTIKPIVYTPGFSNQLFFVYLEHKQKTTDSVNSFKQKATYSKKDINTISDISLKISTVDNIKEFEELIIRHEEVISNILKTPTIKHLYFNDFPGTIKSLGAWGGDFILVTSPLPENETKNYFKGKGYTTIFSWKDIVLQ